MCTVSLHVLIYPSTSPIDSHCSSPSLYSISWIVTSGGNTDACDAITKVALASALSSTVATILLAEFDEHPRLVELLYTTQPGGLFDIFGPRDQFIFTADPQRRIINATRFDRNITFESFETLDPGGTSGAKGGLPFDGLNIAPSKIVEAEPDAARGFVFMAVFAIVTEAMHSPSAGNDRGRGIFSPFRLHVR